MKETHLYCTYMLFKFKLDFISINFQKYKEKDKHKQKHKKQPEPSPALVPSLTVTTEKVSFKCYILFYIRTSCVLAFTFKKCCHSQCPGSLYLFLPL